MISTLLRRCVWYIQRKMEATLTVEKHVRGIRVEVVNTRSDIDTAEVFARMNEALQLIEEYQPRTFRRIESDFANILVRRFPCRAAYYSDSRTCLIELTFAVNPHFTAAQIAASIVHEATHARLFNMGVTPRPDRKAREERLCRRAELEFGLAIPGGRPVIERALDSLSLSDEHVAPNIDWSLASRRSNLVDIT